jgi:hypothetical protein
MNDEDFDYAKKIASYGVWSDVSDIEKERDALKIRISELEDEIKKAKTEERNKILDLLKNNTYSNYDWPGGPISMYGKSWAVWLEAELVKEEIQSIHGV